MLTSPGRPDLTMASCRSSRRRLSAHLGQCQQCQGEWRGAACCREWQDMKREAPARIKAPRPRAPSRFYAEAFFLEEEPQRSPLRMRPG